MAHLNNLLAPGAMPVIGRMFEAGAAQLDDADRTQAPVAGISARTPLSPAAVIPASAAGMAAPSAATRAAPALPFVGTVLGYQPGASITIARQLTLAHDLYLADHNFVRADGVKPLAECFPVLPMTVSLEVMAEAAACLAPGCGLIGFEAVTARRWIAVAEEGALALRIEGRVRGGDAGQGSARIAVQIFTADDSAAAIDATVCFGTHHDVAQPLLAAPGTGRELAAAALYGEHHLFHGPRFQCLAGQVHAGPDGASAELVVRGAHDWFAGEAQPQLLTDAALLDTVGQLAAVWAMQRGYAAFPVGLGRMTLHGPTPAPGARLPIHLRITGQQLKMLIADVEIGDGDGGLWVRIEDWRSWQFEWAPRLVAFQRQPARTLLSETQELPGAPAGLACRRVTAQLLKGFDLALLARHYLHGSEWPAFVAHAALPGRQRDWLLGRVAAKDAARAWCGHPGLHPAAFAVVNDAAGQPGLTGWPPAWPLPRISIAHAGGQAVALASDAAAGIDIEQIAERDAVCVASFCTAAERALLGAVPAAARSAWITRLWCAKEAFGKRLGSGVTGGPHRFEAQSLEPDCSLRMRDAAGGIETHIRTLQDGEYILAVDTAA